MRKKIFGAVVGCLLSLFAFILLLSVTAVLAFLVFIIAPPVAILIFFEEEIEKHTQSKELLILKSIGKLPYFYFGLAIMLGLFYLIGSFAAIYFLYRSIKVGIETGYKYPFNIGRLIIEFVSIFSANLSIKVLNIIYYLFGTPAEEQVQEPVRDEFEEALNASLANENRALQLEEDFKLDEYFKDSSSTDAALLTVDEIDSLKIAVKLQENSIKSLRKEIEPLSIKYNELKALNDELTFDQKGKMTLIYQSLIAKRNKLKDLIEFKDALTNYVDLEKRIKDLEDILQKDLRDEEGYLVSSADIENDVLDEMLKMSIKTPLLLYRKIKTNHAGWQILPNSTFIICQGTLPYFKKANGDKTVYIDPLTMLNIHESSIYSCPDNPKLHGCPTVYKIVEFNEIKDCRELVQIASQLRKKLKPSLTRSNSMDSFWAKKSEEETEQHNLKFALGL